MTARDIAVRDENFPTLSGDIVRDTETLIGELAVGTVVIERGMARLFLVWLSRGFLDIVQEETKCPTCGLEFGSDEPEDGQCPRCQSPVSSVLAPVFATLEEYLSYIADQTGKSRQTLFNRLRVYRSLVEERGVDAAKVFELNLLSSGAASKLASADDDNPYMELENDSWADTVDMALQQDTKGDALAYVKHDVLKEPRILVDQTDDGDYIVYREYLDSNASSGDEYIVEQFEIRPVGDWPEAMVKWLNRKLGAKAMT